MVKFKRRYSEKSSCPNVAFFWSAPTHSVILEYDIKEAGVGFDPTSYNLTDCCITSIAYQPFTHIF